MIGQKISQYQILEKLGEGGMGVVYLAEDTVLGRPVAFKSLKNSSSPEYNQYKTRFLREARLASILNHPNIVSIYDYGETVDGLPYLVMEYVKGKNLSELLRENKLAASEGVRIIKQIARALSEAHEHGIIHRDLKPSNIFINERGEVKVLDFGLAKLLDADSYNSKSYSAATSELFTETREGVFMGTPSYSSPEQLLGTSVDRRSDIFSLGAVFYECLSGQPAFAGKNFAEIRRGRAQSAFQKGGKPLSNRPGINQGFGNRAGRRADSDLFGQFGKFAGDFRRFKILISRFSFGGAQASQTKVNFYKRFDDSGNRRAVARGKRNAAKFFSADGGDRRNTGFV